MWTWEKILKCDEIKRGVRVESKSFYMGLVLRKLKLNDSGVYVIDADDHISFLDSTRDYSDFKFYNHDNKEILPPKERETITLYETMSDFSDVRMCDENGFLPNFMSREMVMHHNEYSKIRKANINKNKSVVLYADTFEVKEWRG